jgi:hypothetical protein
MKPLTVRHAVPVIFQYRQLDAAGGLLSSSNLVGLDQNRRRYFQPELLGGLYVDY